MARHRGLLSTIVLLCLAAGCSEQRAREAEQNIDRASENAGQAVKEGARKTGDALQRGADKAGAAVTSADKKIEKVFRERWIETRWPGVEIEVRNGTATLTGFVENQSERAAVEAEARRMDGVTTVVNRVEVRSGAAEKPNPQVERGRKPATR